MPLIMWVPAFKPGREIDQLAQSVDIMLTILELLGVEIPYYVQGQSLVPLMEKRESYPVHDYVYGETREQAYIRSPKWKLIVHRSCMEQGGCDDDELFKVSKDPKELHDVHVVEQEVYTALRKKISEHLKRLPAYTEKTYTFPPHIDKETQERIKKTGYWG